ncbi:hypothetical protein KY285_037294 [Solanum tuberosum]|nr:hypothetical protein KY289_037511 [Solanum tuberosum]KAH0640708.1 hypothetical protein KY285_037294 [Solanum tuberosum]
MIGVENHEVSGSQWEIAGIVPYCPLGRGFISAEAKLIEILPDGDFCKRASTGCPYLKSS